MSVDQTPGTARVIANHSAWRKALRKDALARRMALSQHECGHNSEAIRHHLHRHFPQLAALRVGFCWPLKNEPDLRPLLAHWQTEGNPSFAALLPVVVAANRPLAFRAWTPETSLNEDRYGIPTPAAGNFLQPQALLIPLVAFDAAGYRLGYGGGFFDRTLASQHPRPLAIGVGFELNRVETIHPEAHDARLDAIVTEAGVMNFT